MHYYWVIFSIVVAFLTLMSLHLFFGSCYWRSKRVMMRTSLFKRSISVALPYFVLYSDYCLIVLCPSKGSQGAQWISTCQLFHHKEGSSSYRWFGMPFCSCDTRIFLICLCLCKGNITHCKSMSGWWHGLVISVTQPVITCNTPTWHWLQYATTIKNIPNFSSNWP
jgi:hypothetical protein